MARIVHVSVCERLRRYVRVVVLNFNFVGVGDSKHLFHTTRSPGGAAGSADGCEFEAHSGSFFFSTTNRHTHRHKEKPKKSSAQKVDSNHWDANPPWI